MYLTLIIFIINNSKKLIKSLQKTTAKINSCTKINIASSYFSERFLQKIFKFFFFFYKYFHLLENLSIKSYEIIFRNEDS